MYKIIILPKAFDDLKRLDKSIAQRIAEKLNWLAKNIEAINPLPLKGNLLGFYKLKFSDWRIIYELDYTKRIIYVHKIGHRSEIYK